VKNAADGPPLSLRIAVACVAASTILAELCLTRVFSVLFYYHFSFFAVALAMSGLAIGGLMAARRASEEVSAADFQILLADLALSGAVAGVTALAFVVCVPLDTTSLVAVILGALIWLPSFVLSGAFLGAAFGRRSQWIGSLYGWDFLAAGAACIVAIALLRRVQGPAALFASPLLLSFAAAVLTPRRKWRVGGMLLGGSVAAVMVYAGARDRPLLGLPEHPPYGSVVFERWNEYSRVQGRIDAAWPDALTFVIDRTAATQMPRIPASANGGPPVPAPSWTTGFQALPYLTGRPLRTVAIIGVGGGRDLLAPLALGAQHVVGFELNRIFVDLLSRQSLEFNALARRPEVTLVNAEARSALRHDPRSFDVVQASLIDTWAATAGGGFVLSENGLYTLDGWRVLLARLTPSGILTMTRWYLPRVPAETYRLVALAATALEQMGVPNARGHIFLATAPPPDFPVDPVVGPVMLSTIMVSRTAFTPEEVTRLRGARMDQPVTVLADPTGRASDSTIDALLDPARRQAAIAASRFDISPPTDLRPFFFLQLRPGHLGQLFRHGDPVRIAGFTFSGLRVLFTLVLCATGLTVVVILLGRARLRQHFPADSAVSWMGLYFFAIGLGYMLVQLGMHQRLTLLLGHPTYALSVVLFSMLVGSGIGAAASARVVPDGRETRAWIAIIAVVGASLAAMAAIPFVDAIDETLLRNVLVGGSLAIIGAALGTAFPVGVRLAAPSGPSTVEWMWAINGAASIAGSAVAALIGLASGSRAVLATGLACYVLAAGCGLSARQLRRRRPAERPSPT
jgi:hypothetical protein